MISEDKLSSFVSKAIDVLLLRNPFRTSIGIVFGIALSGVANFFRPLISRLEWVDLDKVPFYSYPFVGIAIFNIPTARELMTNTSDLPESIQTALALIDEAKAAGMPDEHLKVLYRKLCDMAIQKVGISDDQDSDGKPEAA